MIYDSLKEGKIKESIQQHTSTPHLSARNYWDIKTSELSQSIASRKKIYLDTCYWVNLRDAAMGRPRKPEHTEILDLLRAIVSEGLAICPVSDMAFTELMGQTDDHTRIATAKLLDELSLSVALQFEEYRIRCELEAFLKYPQKSIQETVAPKVWTKAAYIMGPLMPVFKGVQSEDQTIIQKASIDLFWTLNFSHMASESMAKLELGKTFDRIASNINEQKDNHQHEIPSIERALVAEIAGMADQFLDHAEDIMLEYYMSTNNAQAQVPTAEQRQDARKQLRNVMVNIFIHAKEKAKYMLPSMYAHALQHAAFRMDMNRKYQGSFLRDMHHGTAGVVWHDVMLTEKSLTSLLTKNNVGLDKTFGCTVLSSPKDIVRHLHSLE